MGDSSRAGGPSGRIRDFLQRRGAPASSVMIAQRFLRLAVPSEDLATRLLRPLLEPEGMSYQDATGWSPPPSSESGRTAARRVAVLVDPGADRVVAAEVDGPRGAGEAGALDGCIAVMMDPRREGPWLRHWLGRRGLPGPESVVSLASAVRRAARIPRGSGLPEICARLGVRWLEGDRIEDAADAMASCVARAEGAGDRDAGRAREKAGPALPRGTITADDLADLPAAPGVYRFYDEDGALLYVGKAKNLRRRVSSYFRVSRGGGHGARFLDRVHRMEHEVAPSELEALLKEARQIARLAPEGNVQTRVRERRRRYRTARAFALLLPRDGGGASVIIVDRGLYLGHASLGPRGGGLRAARRLIARVLGGREGRRREGRSCRDTEILNSWLARHGDVASRLDLDGFGSVEEAMAGLAQAAGSLAEDAGPAVFRSR